MFAEDLMIGDWVLFDDNLNKIRSLTNDNGCTLSNKLHSVMTYDLKPVPLTSEILEKNGFELKIDPYSNRKYFLLGKNVYNMDVYWINGSILLVEEQYEPQTYAYVCECEYVHELQHKLKDLKIKKDIIL